MRQEDGFRLNEKNNGILVQEKKYWFKPKPYGMGVIPVTWEGWGLSFLFGVVVLGLAWYNGVLDEEAVTDTDGIYFSIEMVVFFFLYIRIIHKNTKGGLQWRWGLKK
jgi:hypothetical protein